MSAEIDVRRCIVRVVQNWWIVVIAMIVAFIASFVLTIHAEPDNYYGEASVCSIVYGSYKESVEGTSEMQKLSEIITSSKVTERAALLLADDSLTSEEIKRMITVNVNEDSMILGIRAYSLDGNLAVRVANAVAKAFIMEGSYITGNDNIQLLDEAEKPVLNYAGSEQQKKIRIFAVLAGAFLAVAGLVVTEVFSTKINSVKDCTLQGEIEIIGVIPEYDKM